MTDPKTNDSLFQTPDPTELKQVRKTEPPQDRAHQVETDVAKTGLEDQTEPDREGAAEMTASQITQVNLSGH